MNKLLLYSLSLFFLGQATDITKRESHLVPHKLDSVQLFKNNERYEALKDTECYKVHDHYNVVLHKSNHDVNNFENYDPTHVSQLSKDKLMDKVNVKRIHVRETAVGFWLSKLAVHAAAQVIYAFVAGAASLVYPPAAPVVYCSLQLTFAAPVEVASNIIANGAR